jgi:hypothetical protein
MCLLFALLDCDNYHQRLTVSVTRWWAGVDNDWEQEKLEASLPWRARPGKNDRKRRRIPAVQCTLCWAAF